MLSMLTIQKFQKKLKHFTIPVQSSPGLQPSPGVSYVDYLRVGRGSALKILQ